MLLGLPKCSFDVINIYELGLQWFLMLSATYKKKSYLQLYAAVNSLCAL